MSSFFKSFRSSKRPSQLPSTWSNDHSHDGRDDLPVVSFPTPTHYVPTPEGSYSQPTNSDARDHAEVLRLQQDLQTAQERIRNLEDRMWELMQENQALKTQVTANATAGGTPHDDSGQAQTTSHANEDGANPGQRTNEMSMMDGRDDGAPPVFKDYWPSPALQGMSITAAGKKSDISSDPIGSSSSAQVPVVREKVWSEYTRIDVTNVEGQYKFIQRTYQVYPSGIHNCMKFTESFFQKFNPEHFSLWRITGPQPGTGSIEREFITLNKANRLLQVIKRARCTSLFAIFDILKYDNSGHTRSEGLFLFPNPYLHPTIRHIMHEQDFRCESLIMFNAKDREYVNDLFGCSKVRTQLDLVRKRVFYY